MTLREFALFCTLPLAAADLSPANAPQLKEAWRFDTHAQAPATGHAAIGDNGRAVMERGTVRAFDTRTGKALWTWDPTPIGQTGAANAWAPLAVAPRATSFSFPPAAPRPTSTAAFDPAITATPTPSPRSRLPAESNAGASKSCTTIFGTTMSSPAPY